MTDSGYVMTEADLNVADIKSPDGWRRGGWWAARCKHCDAWLAKYEFTRADAVAAALSEDREHGHACWGTR